MVINKKIFGFLILALLAACNKSEPPMPAPSVVTQQAQATELVSTSSYAGTVTTVEMVELLPRIEGYLLARRFEQGQLVKKGDLLFVIEPDQYQATVLQKQADLSAAQATLAERSLNYERFKALYEKKVVAKANLDQAESDYYNSKANVEAASATLTNAQLDLSYTKIYAPITGRIGVTQFSPGDYLSPTTSTLATIVQLDPIRVVFSIPEQEWLAIETSAHRTADNLDGFLQPKIKLSNGALYDTVGRIAFVDNHIDDKTGALAVYADFANPNALLLPGQFVTVIIERGQPRKGLLVPSGAVLFDKTGHYLLLVTPDNHVEQRYVKVGLTQQGKTEVTEGLNPDEVFIVEGLAKSDAWHDRRAYYKKDGVI